MIEEQHEDVTGAISLLETCERKVQNMQGLERPAEGAAPGAARVHTARKVFHCVKR